MQVELQIENPYWGKQMTQKFEECVVDATNSPNFFTFDGLLFFILKAHLHLFPNLDKTSLHT